MRSFSAQDAARLLPVPSGDANKYTRGALAVIAGSAKYPGAAVLAAQASIRAGAGYATLVTPGSAALSARTHLVSVPVRGTAEEDGAFCAASISEALDVVASSKSAVLGPGLDRTQGAQDFVWGLLGHPESQGVPFVIDADALFAIAQDKKRFDDARPAGCSQVLTPHEGEAARLLGYKVEDRMEAAAELALRWHSVVVLKGPKTIVASPAGVAKVIENAGPELAKAGTGDVLAGMVGALLAQGMVEMDAACLGVYLHGRAGALIAQKLSPVSLMPEDLLEYIGYAIRSLENWSPQLASAQADVARRVQL